METKVVNTHPDKHGRAKFDVNVRTGYFATPFKPGRACPACGKLLTVEHALAAFERYVNQRAVLDLEFRAALKGLAGKTLGCTCAPNPCHGDVLARCAEDLAAGVWEASGVATWYFSCLTGKPVTPETALKHLEYATLLAQAELLTPF